MPESRITAHMSFCSCLIDKMIDKLRKKMMVVNTPGVRWLYLLQGNATFVAECHANEIRPEGAIRKSH
jgi:hypothetical protein